MGLETESYFSTSSSQKAIHICRRLGRFVALFVVYLPVINAFHHAAFRAKQSQRFPKALFNKQQSRLRRSSFLLVSPEYDTEMQHVPTWKFQAQQSLDDGTEIVFQDLPGGNSQLAAAALATWRWCKKFVVPYELCPWAEGSVNSLGSVQMFLSGDNYAGDSTVMEILAKRFLFSIAEGTLDPHKGIFFVVLLQDSMVDFEAFYEWYTELEDTWELFDDVTLAPFHPQWTYGKDDDSLCIEKRSPFPTVSLVSTKIIDQAGEIATQRIAAINEEILMQKTASEWSSIYNEAVGNRYNSDEQA